ncbi:unnamed protein product [Cylicostephanus goldi]|uniref:Uncharacterized protein n=1 Tax=Cylicostephanus goldi TaxID=71465 RepID=A0A3P7P5R7_CYLGO|nr:unnamed protein product [Cylicostephanus goldi]
MREVFDLSMEPEDILLEDERVQRPVPKKLLLSKNEEPPSAGECKFKEVFHR